VVRGRDQQVGAARPALKLKGCSKVVIKISSQPLQPACCPYLMLTTVRITSAHLMSSLTQDCRIKTDKLDRSQTDNGRKVPFARVKTCAVGTLHSIIEY